MTPDLLPERTNHSNMQRVGRPYTPNRKKSLKKLQKVLHDLDDVTRVMLGEVPGANWKGPVQNMQEQIALCLKYWTVS